MSLSLTLNGVTTATIPGSPASGDRIAMSNGVVRISFVWIGARGGTQWWTDLLEWSPDGGASWQTALYCRQAMKFTTPDGTERNMANAALSIITNTAGTLTLQMLSSQTQTQVYTYTTRITMTTANPNIEFQEWLALSAQATCTSGKQIETRGLCLWSPGLSTNSPAFFNYAQSPFATPRCNPMLYVGNAQFQRIFATVANVNGRGYICGASMLTGNNLLCTFIESPVDLQNLYQNIRAVDNSVQCGTKWQMTHHSLQTFVKATDGAYQSNFDNTPSFIKPSIFFGNSGAPTFPQSASNTDATTTLNHKWSMIVEQMPASTLGGNPCDAYIMPQRMNYWLDTLYPRPSVGGANNLGGGSGPFWQSLATMENSINPVMSSTYATNWLTNYGHYVFDGNNTSASSHSNALALQVCLRWLNFGVGNADAQAAADNFALVLANYQTQAGVQKGAFQRNRNPVGSNFLCQDQPHAASGDQPHVSTFTMAECVLALIEYYRARGNQTLAATYGNISVATLLDQAAAYFTLVQQADGGWLVEYNNANAATSNAPQNGASWAGAATPDIAASLYQWATLSPTATAPQIASWKQAGIRGLLYHMTSESSNHGCFEYGEDYVLISHYAIKMLVRGFARAYKLLGGQRYIDWMAYYFELGILSCKRVDELVNTSFTGNQDVHTGALMSTQDWNGVVAGEGSSVWAILMTDGLQLHPNLLSYHYFYLWASLAHVTWSFRDQPTWLSSYPMSYSYISPYTGGSGVNGIDTTRILFFAPSGALHLLPTRTLVACDNVNVLAVCLEANFASTTPAGRTIMLYNPQSTSQTVNLTVRGMAGRNAQQDGVSIASSKSGSDLAIGPLQLSAGQISKVTIR